MTAVPFPTDAFDVVTSFDVLYALEGEALRAAVTEMFRVARPGGFLIVNVAAMQSPSRRSFGARAAKSSGTAGRLSGGSSRTPDSRFSG